MPPAQIVKERRATFAATPAQLARRPGARRAGTIWSWPAIGPIPACPPPSKARSARASRAADALAGAELRPEQKILSGESRRSNLSPLARSAEIRPSPDMSDAASTVPRADPTPSRSRPRRAPRRRRAHRRAGRRRALGLRARGRRHHPGRIHAAPALPRRDRRRAARRARRIICAPSRASMAAGRCSTAAISTSRPASKPISR